MGSFRLSEGVSSVFNEKVSLSDLRTVDAGSLFILLASKSLLFLGISLVLLNNLNVIAPGTYFGKFSWVTVIVFIIGILLNFVSIPLLYFSSLDNFKKENCFWDKETFWILPVFFFGTFFLHSAEISFANALFILSVVMVLLIHSWFILEARKFIINDSEEKFFGQDQYYVTLKYLTAYYTLLLLLLTIYNPLHHAFFWIRMNF